MESPLQHCPNPAVNNTNARFLQYRDRNYLVFLDESFYKFFGLARRDGNFCYGCIGIPEEKYDLLKSGLATLLGEYQQISRMSGGEPKELKFSPHFLKLPKPFKRRFGLCLRNLLHRNGGFVLGYFVPVDGLVMERVRESCLSRGLKEVPHEHSAEYETARTDLLTRRVNVFDSVGSHNYTRGVGESSILCYLTANVLLNVNGLLAAANCPFRVVYDPRERSEDAAVSEHQLILNEIFSLLPSSLHTHCRFTTETASNNELGIQLADVMAGEFRQFFRKNDGLLTAESSLKLIPSGQGDQMRGWIIPSEGARKAVGICRLRPIPSSSMRCFYPPSESLVPYFREMFAINGLVCFTHKGEHRHIEIAAKQFADEADNPDPYME